MYNHYIYFRVGFNPLNGMSQFHEAPRISTARYLSFVYSCQVLWNRPSQIL